MDDPRIFDTVQAVSAVSLGTSHSGERYQYRVPVRHLVDDQVIAEAVIRAHMTATEHVQARLPVEEFVRRAVETAAGSPQRRPQAGDTA